MDHFSVIYLLALVFSASVDAKSDEEACISLMKNMKSMCCETMKAMAHEDDHKCEVGDDWTCEDSRCILDKRGLMNGDDVDDAKFSDLMADWEDKDPDVAPMRKRVENSCLGGKYKELDAKDMCDATKFHICVGLNFMVECQKWKDTDGCKGMPEDAKQCKNMMDQE